MAYRNDYRVRPISSHEGYVLTMQKRKYDDYFIPTPSNNDGSEGLLESTNQVVLTKPIWRVPVARATLTKIAQAEGVKDCQLLVLSNVYLSQTAALTILQGGTLAQLFDDTEVNTPLYQNLILVYTSSLDLVMPPTKISNVVLAQMFSSEPFNKESLRLALFKEMTRFFNNLTPSSN